jgi:hypothetical protein
MKKPMLWALAIVAAVAVAALLYYQLQTVPPEPQAQVAPPTEAAPAPQVKAEPEIRYPIEVEVEEKPLPALDESDEAARARIAELVGEPSLVELLNLQTFVRRVVATVDNLPRKKLAPRLMPVKPASGPFVTADKDDALVLSEKNFARYAPYVRLLDAVDTKKLVTFYTQFYPLFQKAYEDLGYPGAYFNDRLVEVIDDLLAAPQVDGPIRLVRPKIYYRFADPELEALSAGQKIFIRIGPANAEKAKAKLREIRSALVAKAPDR